LTELAQTAFETVDTVMSDHITVRVKSRTNRKAINDRRADMLGRIIVDYSVSQFVLTHDRPRAD
jgi:hypothetical protein